jgi:hypothetical protein
VETKRNNLCTISGAILAVEIWGTGAFQAWRYGLLLNKPIRILSPEVGESKVVIDELTPFLCRRYARGFAEEAAINNHAILVHTTMSFLCHACHVHFDDRLALRQHQIAAHTKPPKDNAATTALESADDA